MKYVRDIISRKALLIVSPRVQRHRNILLDSPSNPRSAPFAKAPFEITSSLLPLAYPRGGGLRPQTRTASSNFFCKFMYTITQGIFTIPSAGEISPPAFLLAPQSFGDC